MYEMADGSKVPKKMYVFFNQITEDLGERMEQPLQFMFTSLLSYEIGAFDKRFVRNVTIFRNYFIEELNRRKQKPLENANDLMSMLMNDPVYKGHDGVIIDDVWSMLLAGMKTIQVSSSNLIMWSTFHPEVKKRLVDEIDSKLNPIADNL